MQNRKMKTYANDFITLFDRHGTIHSPIMVVYANNWSNSQYDGPDVQDTSSSYWIGNEQRIDKRIVEIQKNNLKEKVKSFETLNKDWAGRNTILPSSVAIENSMRFVDLLPSSGKLPEVSVAGDGEVNFYWDFEGVFIDVGLFCDNKIYYYINVYTIGVDEDGAEIFNKRSLPGPLESAIRAV